MNNDLENAVINALCENWFVSDSDKENWKCTLTNIVGDIADVTLKSKESGETWCYKALFDAQKKEVIDIILVVD